MKIISGFFCASFLLFSTFSITNATVLINEVDYDQDGSDTAEFIELFNSGLHSISLTGYRLDLINGNSTTNPIYKSIDLTSYSIAASGYLVICGNLSTVINCNYDAGSNSGLIQNGNPGGDGIALYDASNALIDSITYEGDISGFTEGSSITLADKNSGIVSIGRLLNSQDTDNNAADFERGCITPGTANIAGNGDCSVTATITATVPQPPVIWLFIIGLIGIAASTTGRKGASICSALQLNFNT